MTNFIDFMDDDEFSEKQDFAVSKIFSEIFPGANKFNQYGTGPMIKGDAFLMYVYESILRNSGFSKPSNNSLLHFTTIQSAFKILNEKSIRMYNFSSLEDPMELKYYLSHFEKTGFTDIDYQLENQFVLSGVDKGLLGTEHELHAWRAFGDKGNGCALEFEVMDIKDGEYRFAEVLYKEPNVDKIVKSLNEFENKFKHKFNANALFSLAAGYYKHPAYSIEKEKRLLMRREVTNIFNVPVNPLILGEIHKEISTGKVNYYINISIDPNYKSRNDPKLKLKKIVFGPRVSESLFDFWRDELLISFIPPLSDTNNKIEIIQSDAIPMRK